MITNVPLRKGVRRSLNEQREREANRERARVEFMSEGERLTLAERGARQDRFLCVEDVEAVAIKRRIRNRRSF